MTQVSDNTGNLGGFGPFHAVGFRRGDDGHGRFGRVAWNVVLGAFEGPAGDFSFDDTGVGSSPPWWEQAVQ
jgi:hypothetical protein